MPFEHRLQSMINSGNNCKFASVKDQNDLDMTNGATASHANTDILPLFIALVKCGIGKVSELPSVPNALQWDSLFELSCKQALQGIAFAGIERLPQHQRPSSSLILKWFQTVMAIRVNNKELTRKSVAVSDKFINEGFRNAVLKGQGVAQYSPDPSLRVAGDIDIWLKGGCDAVLNYVRRFVPGCAPTYHHVDFPVGKGLDIEVHYRPTWMYNPFHNARLQKYFASREEIEFTSTVSTSEGDLHVPSTQFNLVYIPIHIYRHLFDEGIGLRQILDYYFVLQHSTSEERHHCVKLFKSIGMLRFMRALTYVMQQMFALDEEYMVFVPSPKEGRFLFNEIIEAGNFGKTDSRYQQSARGFNVPHFRNQLKRSSILFCHYPSETFWNPFFKVWHYFWRKRHTSL